ncbi:MAG: DUF1367 family protein [Burkholderiaceae bacterium]
MSDVVIFKGDDGKLQGFGQKGGRAYAKWRTTVENLEVGETLQFSWRAPRSPKFHRMFFGMLGQLFDRQEQFADVEQLRAWLAVGAGYCEFVPGPKGRMVALPKSIAWASMDDTEFRELVVAVWDFIRTEHAQRFLWPHLEPAETDMTVEELLIGWQP